MSYRLLAHTRRLSAKARKHRACIVLAAAALGTVASAWWPGARAIATGLRWCQGVREYEARAVIEWRRDWRFPRVEDELSAVGQRLLGWSVVSDLAERYRAAEKLLWQPSSAFSVRYVVVEYAGVPQAVAGPTRREATTIQRSACGLALLIALAAWRLWLPAVRRLLRR